MLEENKTQDYGSLQGPRQENPNAEQPNHRRAVFQFNQQEVEESGVFLKLVRWEDMAPQIGPGPQQVINNQIGDL